jgi:hypothetical protein
MKLKVYCASCGALHEYTAEKPNFCQKCGTVFAHAQAQKTTPPIDTEEQHGQPKFDLQTMQGLDYELEALAGPQTGQTLGDILNGPQEKQWTDKELGIKGKRGRPKKVNKDQVLKDFAKEAGSLKQKPK